MFIQVRPMGDVASVLKLVQDYVWSNRDKKTDGWFMVENPMFVSMLCLFYVIFSAYLGPKLMENRKPFEWHRTYATILFGVTAINLWVHYEFWASGWATGYKFICENVDYSINPASLRMANTCWWFYMLKYLDWSYTIINVLRKKFNRITDQHVIHHATMVTHGYGLVRFVPGGQATFICVLNTMFHAISFFYFGIATLWPKSKFRQAMASTMKYLNLAELIWVPIHMMMPVFVNCEYPRIIIIITVVSALLYLLLFMKQFCCKQEPRDSVDMTQYRKIVNNCEIDVNDDVNQDKVITRNLI